MSNSRLLARAQAMVERTKSKLPTDLRGPASQVPVCICDYPSPDIVSDDIDPDILGLFVGDPLGVPPGLGNAVPAQIFLFVENILDEADGDLEIFDEEVRITYLHELVHYLGWDEDDVEARGL